jgi:flagellar hook protein FlgE
MLRSLSSAVSGLSSEQTAMDVTGNNIANASTTGFKTTEVQFGSLLSQTITAGTAPNAAAGVAGGQNPEAVGLGVNVSAMNQEMGQGSLQETGVPTDLALQGNGFFVLNSGTATYYTRAGNMQLDKAGNVVEGANGWEVQGWSAVTTTPGATTATLGAWPPSATYTASAPTGLTIPQEIAGGQQGTTAGATYALQSFSINSDGTITGVYAQVPPAGTTPTASTPTVSVVLGQIAVATVANPGGLDPVGNTAYSVAPDSGTPKLGAPGAGGNATITTGALEMSNVNLAQEMSNMVTYEAGYEADAKVIYTAQQMIAALMAMKL